MANIKVCKRCVMDDRSDQRIVFDGRGYCNYCEEAISRMPTAYYPNEIGAAKLEAMFSKLKREGQGHKFDCLVGLSGGLDSSYLAYIGHKNGLRMLGVSVDDGFNTKIAEENVARLAKACSMELIIVRPNKEQFCDLTRAFMLAGVPNIAIPQDNVLRACLFDVAKQNKLRTFLSGANFSMESILQRDNTHNASDSVHIKAIHGKFGTIPLGSLPLVSLVQNYVSKMYLDKISFLRPLDYLDYRKDKSIQELKDFCGFNYYGGKHYESIFTRFVQTYYLPKKFNVDKRTSHLSSLIVSGQMTRAEALHELSKPLYDEAEMDKDITFILGMLKLTRQEFDAIMTGPKHRHTEYEVSHLTKFAALARKFRKYLGN